jgi:sugar lactone lactonase YvrE
VEFEVLASGYGLAEAPTIDTDGTLLFSDVLGGGVYRLGTDRDVTTVVPKRRGVGGIAIHRDGGLICSGRDVIHVRDGENRTVLHVDGVAGWNDLGTDSRGRVYVGALRFAVFDPAAVVVPGELWRIDGAGTEEVIVDSVMHANGVGCSLDGSIVYLSDTRARRLIVHDLQRRERRVIDVSPYGTPDGLALDERGDVWLALVDGGIGRFAADGTFRDRLDVPSTVVTSLCFGGTDGRDLFVTTGGHSERPELRGCVLRTRVDVAGAPVVPARV